MQLVIIAGGKGTRLKERTAHLPKPMVNVAGKPLLEHQVLLARQCGFNDILMLTGYGAEYIEEYFGDGSRWGVGIRYHREDEPAGTAGAVLEAFDKLENRFLVMYGDTMLNVDLARLFAAHPDGALATLFLHPNDHPHDSDLVEMDQANRISAFHPYPHPPGSCFRNLVNAALYVLEKQALAQWRQSPAFRSAADFAKHLFPALIRAGAHLHGYVSREYIKDAGTPARLDRVCSDLTSGRIERSSLSNPLPAIFLDRDGTLNFERGFIRSPEQLELIPGAAEAVHAINGSGNLAVVITNQPVIARGECAEEELRRIHNRLEWLLGESHAYLDAIYFCPHHPDAGFAGERPELKTKCACRKPGSALFEQAARDLNIDLENSWMIGDRVSDIQAAQNLAIRSAWVRTAIDPDPPEGCEPHQVFDSVLHAVEFILPELESA